MLQLIRALMAKPYYVVARKHLARAIFYTDHYEPYSYGFEKGKQHLKLARLYAEIADSLCGEQG